MTTVVDRAAAPAEPAVEPAVEPPAPRRRAVRPGPLRAAWSAAATHLPAAAASAGVVAVLFRTWLAGGLPGGVDSAFTYSALPLFSTYGAARFTVWLPLQMGQVQQYSTYWLLAMVVSLTRSAVVTYELASVALALGTFAILYGLMWWLARNRLAAAVAATLYAFSPFAVSQWLDGHLDVQVAIALGPLAIWMVLVVLRAGSTAAAIALGLCGSALFLLTTGEAAYWLVPAGAVALVELATLARRRVRVVSRAARGAAVALGTFLVASAVQLVPLAAGVKAPFLDSSANYYVESLAVHEKYSLSILSNVLGVPRESWLPSSISLAAVPFDSVWWALFVLAVLCVAVSSLRTRFRTLAAVLLSVAVASWLLASGPSGPAGGAYRALYDTVPYFKFLRVPNRWLMVSTFCVAIAAGFGVTRLCDRAATARDSARWRLTRRVPAAARGIGIVACCGALAACSAGGILARGMPTVHPPGDMVAAYSSLRADPGDWRVLTTPYYQAWMPSGSADPALGNYESILSDLGDVSSQWTGHNVVGRGGWDPRAAQFATYLYDTVRQGSNTRLAGLLGAATVKYVGIDPQAASEVVSGQNQFFLRQHGLSVRVRHGRYTILENSLAQPIAYVTPTFCVVAGGLQVLGDLSADPRFSFARTGVVFADQAVATSGAASLPRLVREAGCVIEAPGGAQSLQVLAHATATAQLSGVAPGAWPRVSVNPLLDVAADPAIAVLLPEARALAWRTAPTSSRGLVRPWVRALVGPNEGDVEVRVDGRPAGRLALSRPAVLGFKWMPAGALALGPGRHTVSLRRVGGTEVQAVAAALVAGAATAWRAPRADVVRVVRDVNDLSSSLYAGPAHAVALASAPWQPIGAAVASARPGVLSIPRLPDLRSYFTIAKAAVRRPVDPGVPFGIAFRGTGSGQEFYLNFFFSHADAPTVSFRFRDTSRRTVVQYFSPQLAPIADQVPDWQHVTAVSLSTNSKAALPGGVSLVGPFSAAGARHGVLGELPSGTATGAHARSVAGDQRVGTSARLDHVGRGLLVFTQSYAPGWHLTGATSSAHTVALGYANAYVVTAPAGTATITYAPAVLGRIGSAVSLLGWLGALAVLLLLGATRAQRRRGAPRPSEEGPR